MKKRIPFDSKIASTNNDARPILECGIDAKILSWDVGGDYPIVVMPDKADGYPYRINNQGEPFPATMSKVYLEVDDEMSEFEHAVEDLISQFVMVSEETVKHEAAKLLMIARKEFIMPSRPVDVLALLKSLNLRILEIADEKRGQDKKFWEQAWRLTNNAINSIQDKEVINC